jgi:hypothetical protein
MTGFSSDRAGPQLMNIATDGESYGHHHRFGDMALAIALNALRESGASSVNQLRRISGKIPPRLGSPDSRKLLLELFPWG